ncbi:predicted protein [Lichtheimia corymbifera JMRC:FSU:9682]|uniref:HMG box domain-containing protein n=1 Tax=Lichtheimia corymbifera JMRC:FSU:9682 TaxID=1263082 RepID=A0A068SC71_9FUNG|nr:predicted protein [Lichtheimia corymbifera JMRC:FSU:9682]
MPNDADQSSPVKRLSQVCIDAAHQMVLLADLLSEIPARPVEKKTRQPRAPDMPKYPRSSYILFSDDHRQETRKETKSGRASDIVTLLAHKWNALGDAEKQPYIIKAKQERKRYEMEMEAYCAKLAAESLGGEGGEPVATTTPSSNDDSSLKSDGDDQSSNDDAGEGGEPVATTTTSSNDGSSLKSDGDDQSSNDNADESSDNSGSSGDDDDGDISSSETDTDSSDTGSSASQVVELPVPPPQNLTKPKDAAVKKKESIVKPTEKAKQLVINNNIAKHNIAPKQSIKGKQPAKPIEKQSAKSIEKLYAKFTETRSHESSKRPASSISHDTQSNKVKKPKRLKH